MGGWEGVWRCDDLEEEEMQFLCTATGVFVFGKGGKYVRGPRERTRGKERERRESRENDGGKYDLGKESYGGF